MPFSAAAMVPAVWVPWPLSSVRRRGLDRPRRRRRRRCSRSRCSARRSGCVKSSPGVDVADEHGRAPAVDRVSLWGMDLRHVPLPLRQAVAPRGGHARVVRCRAGSLLGQVGRLEVPNWLVAETPWIRRSFFIVAANPSFEGPRDGHADLRVARYERAAGGLDLRRGVAGYRQLLVQDDVRRAECRRSPRRRRLPASRPQSIHFLHQESPLTSVNA